MKKKKRIISLIIIVLVLAVVFLFILTSRLSGGLFKTSTGDSLEVIDEYDLTNLDNAPTATGTGFIIPTVDSNLAVEAVVANFEPQIAPVNTDYPEKAEAVNFRPSKSSAEQKEQLVQIGSKSFEPKEIGGIPGAAAVVTFEAIDDQVHKVVFTDKELSFLSLSLKSISKQNGAAKVIFAVPAAGNYNFYVDSEDNRGVLKVVSN
jgi:plastocyanin